MGWQQIAGIAGFIGILIVFVVGMFQATLRKPDPKGNKIYSVGQDDGGTSGGGD